MKEDYSKTNLIFSLAAFFIGYLYFIIRGINYFSLMIYEHTGKSLLYFRGAFFNEIFEREHSFIYMISSLLITLLAGVISYIIYRYVFSFKTAVMLLAGFAVPLATAVSPVAQLFACLIYFIVLAVFAVCDMRNYEAD